MPKISVCMPTWNRGYSIANAIASIINQSFRDWELIIVSDGSTDNTERVVESFVSNKIKFFNIPHQNSISKVRNYCNKQANGELIVIQDSDDTSYPDRLETIWEFYKKENPDVIYHDMYVRSNDPIHNCFVMEKRTIGEYNKDKLIHKQYIPGQIAYKRSVWEKTSYEEELLIADDMMFLLEFALNNYTFGYISRPLYEYNIFEDSINIKAELDGRRFEDTRTMVRLLKERYGLKVTGELKQWEKMTGRILKQNYVS